MCILLRVNAVEDLSAYAISGAVKASPPAGRRFPSECRTPAEGIADGIEAERLGFSRVWVSERYDIKHADVVLSGIAARTERIRLATGTIDPQTRQIWNTAAFARRCTPAMDRASTCASGSATTQYFATWGCARPATAKSLNT